MASSSKDSDPEPDQAPNADEDSQDNTDKHDTSTESDSSKDGSEVPEMHARETDSSSSSCKRKMKGSKAKSKKKGIPSSPSMAGPSTSAEPGSAMWFELIKREECPICRKLLGRNKKLIGIPECCAHAFCYECISAWVTKAKSNCPMDRKNIRYLQIFDDGVYISSTRVQHKVPEEEEIAPDDEGEICPDCGWVGIRPSIGVCMHCMFHHDHPWPVEDCPQCMEAESVTSDDEQDQTWNPANLRIRGSDGSESYRGFSSPEPTPVHSSDSEDPDYDEDDEEISAEEQEPVPATTQRKAPVRRKTRRKVARRKKRKTVARRTTTAKRKTTATRRKRKTKKRSTTTATTRRRRKTTKRKTTKKRRKVTTKARRNLSRRKFGPSDSAKARLAKLLGLKPPKNPGQTIPRGCRPRPVTIAQIAAAASTSAAGMVTNRPVGSLSYHHSAFPTLHLFGGDELEDFHSDSGSDHGDTGAATISGVSVIFPRPRRILPSDNRIARQKGIISPTPAIPQVHDVLGSILESQSMRNTPFTIWSENSNSRTPVSSLREKPMQLFGDSQSMKAVSRRPLNPSQESSNKTPPPSTQTTSHNSSQSTNCVNYYANQEYNNLPSSSTNHYAPENMEQHANLQCDSTFVNSKTKLSPEMQEEDDEIDLYGDIPSTNVPRVTSEDSVPSFHNCNSVSKSPLISEEQFETSMASMASDASEGEMDEGMIIDETEPGHQSSSCSSVCSKCIGPPMEPTDAPDTYKSDSCAEPLSPKYGDQSPCYGGGSPAYKAADTQDGLQFQTDMYPTQPVPADVCPNLFTYSAASIDIARSSGNEDEEVTTTRNSEHESPTTNVAPSETRVEHVNEATHGSTTTLKPRKKINSKSKRRQSLVEEIFGSDIEDIEGSNNNTRPSPSKPSVPVSSTHMTGLEGLDTETISETEEEANFNDYDETEAMYRNPDYPIRSKSGLANRSEPLIDYEEGEIVEDRSKLPTVVPETVSDVEPAFPVKEQIPDRHASPGTELIPDKHPSPGVELVPATQNPLVATSPVSPDPSVHDIPQTFEQSTPASPVVQNEERPPSRSASPRRRNSKLRSPPERKRNREERSRKDNKGSNKSDPGNIAWKKLSKSTKERNYRDGKAKENVSNDRSERREKSSRDDRRSSRRKKEKRKDLERYDVRKVITERSRREAERRRRDKFGRDISRERTHSRSPATSRSPQPLSHHQPRHRRHTPETEYISRNRDSSRRRHRNNSWSSNSRFTSSSSRGSSPHVNYPPRRDSSNHRRQRRHSRDNTDYHKGRRKSLTPSPSRTLNRDLPRGARRERSCSFSQVAPGLVTIVTARDRITTSSHMVNAGHMNDALISATVASLSNIAAKKKLEKAKEKLKKGGKKKKKEHHRHILAPIAPAGGIPNNNTTSGGSAAPLPGQEKKKRKREKSPPASKEVFASGDNILVSVNFNKPSTTNIQLPPGPHLGPSVSKCSKESTMSMLPAIHNVSGPQKRIVKGPTLMRGEMQDRSLPKRPPRRDVLRKPSDHISERSPPRHKNTEPPRMMVPEKSQGPQHPGHPHPQHPPVPNIRRRPDGMKRRKRIAAEIAAKRKPVAIIDLESSPFAERAASPAEIITLSDNESRMSSSSQCSRRSSIDDRRDMKRCTKDDRPRKQRKPSKADGKNMDHQFSMSAPTVSTTSTVALGPKTPPEPQIKFSINAKPQLRSILNPLQDEDDDLDLDSGNGVNVAPREKSDVDLNNSVTSGHCVVGSIMPNMIVGSHTIPPTFRGPNTPPEPCTTQSRSSSCSTTTKLDMEPSQGNNHAPSSPVDAKSPDAYDPFEPTKSPSDVSSSGQQLESQNNIDSLSEVHESAINTGHLTPGTMSDNSNQSSCRKAHIPESPTPEGLDHERTVMGGEESVMMDENMKKIETNVPTMVSHSNISQSEDRSRSPPSGSCAPTIESAEPSEVKATATNVVFPPPLVATQGLITTLPPGVANILCASQHQALFRPQLGGTTIATIPFVLAATAPPILGLRVSQQSLLTTSQQTQHSQSSIQQQSQQQQQPDTTTTTDVVDMDLESPYSPASSEGDDLFEPPDKPPSPAYPPSRKEKSHVSKSLRNAHPKRTAADKFDLLFNQSTPLKKEVTSTSGNRSNAHGRTGHGHRGVTSKSLHTKADSKSTKLSHQQKTRAKIHGGTTEKNKTGKKEISIKMDEDQLKILDDLPSSAVEMQVKEKFLKKLNRQERVVEEVKLALKPHYTKKSINKEEYKEILRRSVPKICHNKTGEINPIRIRSLVQEYVKKFRYLKKKESSKRGKADKQR